jgi:hypothetical protein
MTIALAYNDDLSRVQITLTSMDHDGLVRVERSTNQLFWQTVRGGVILPIDSGAGALDDYEFSANVQNFYRVISVDPEPGLLLPGAAGDYASTPDHASLDIVGDIDLAVEATLADWSSGSIQNFIGKSNAAATQNSYRLRVTATGFLEISWTEDGSTVKARTSTVALPVDSGRLAVRATLDVDNGASGHTVTFDTAASIDGPWVPLGDPVVTASTTSIFSGTAGLAVGAAVDDGSTHPVTGTIHKAYVKSGIAGTVAADPDFAAQAHGATSFADSTSKTWTINGNGEVIGEVLEADSITPDLEGETWIKSIRYPFLNRPSECNAWDEITRAARTGIHPISGRSAPIAVTDLRLGQRFTLTVVTRTLEQARDFDLILASGAVMFIQTPPETPEECAKVSAIPGGYVVFEDTVQRRILPGSQEMVWILPCAVIAPPEATVVGTTMTWATIFDLYGNWNAVIAANPTWADLLAGVASPNDLVVL